MAIIDINIATPNLQEVTDSGNTTNNDIAFTDNAGVLLENTSRLREGTIDSGAGGGIAQICAVGYELKWEAGSQYVMDGNGLLIREVNHKFNIVPDINNDDTQGYYVGSRWILDNGDVYICTDSTSTAAVWEIVANADWNATTGSTAIANKPTIPSVTGFVPYTGATTDLDMGTHNVTADHISLNVSPSGAGFVVGSTQWNNTLGSSQTLLKGGNVTLKNGVDLVARIVNKVTPNTTLTKANYQAVRVSGATGGRLSVELARADSDTNSADTIGLVCETIATNQEGFIITVGQLLDVNTTGSLQGETWVDGDVLYLSPTTAGRITKVKPTGAGHIVVIGYVEYAHANNGKIYVKIMNGWELDELHDVAITSVADNNLLQYDSATSLWKNESLSTAGIQPTLVSATNIKTVNGNSLLGSGDLVVGGGITVGTTAVTSGTVGRVFFQGAGNVVQQSANLTYDGTLGFEVGNNTVGYVKTSTQNISGVNVGEITNYSLNNFPLVRLTGTDLSTYFSGRIGLYYGNTEKAYLKASSLGGEIGGFNSLLLKAKGALSTDIALRVRNSADTFNILNAVGTGQVWSNGKGGITTNTAYGENVFEPITSGYLNGAFGRYALQNVTSGYENNAFGYMALNSLTSGYNNTSIGYQAGRFITSGTFNTAVGAFALQLNTSVFGYNTAIGHASLQDSIGAYNTGLGYWAGKGITSGQYNTIIGFSPVSGITTGSGNTIVGSQIGAIGNVSNTAIFADGNGNIALRKDANHFVGVGYSATATLGAKLDVRAQGAGSTDFALRVRNSADTSNLFVVKGNGVLNAANLPTSPAGLVTGDIWNNLGILTIV